MEPGFTSGLRPRKIVVERDVPHPRRLSGSPHASWETDAPLKARRFRIGTEVFQAGPRRAPRRSPFETVALWRRDPGLTDRPSRLLADPAEHDLERCREIPRCGHFHDERVQQAGFFFQPLEDRVGPGQFGCPLGDFLFELVLAVPQVPFGLLLRLDIGAGPEPPDDLSARVAEWKCASEVPLVTAVEPPESIFDFEDVPRAEGFGPELDLDVHFLGVKHALPAPPEQFVVRQSGVLEAALVVVLDVAVRSRDPDELRKGVGEVAEILLAGDDRHGAIAARL